MSSPYLQAVCRSTDMFTKAGKPMYRKSVWKPGGIHYYGTNPVNVSLTISYDDNTYYLLRITRLKIIERRQNMCTLAVAACVDVMVDRVRVAMVKLVRTPLNNLLHGF